MSGQRSRSTPYDAPPDAEDALVGAGLGAGDGVADGDAEEELLPGAVACGEAGPLEPHPPSRPATARTSAGTVVALRVTSSAPGIGRCAAGPDRHAPVARTLGVTGRTGKARAPPRPPDRMGAGPTSAPEGGRMSRLSRLVVRHRMLVSLLWLALFAAGAATASTTVDRLSFDFSLPGQPGYETDARLLEVYGNGGTNPPVIPVVTVPEGSTVESRAAEVAAVFAGLRERFPEARVLDHATTRDPVFLTDDGRTTFGLVFTPPPAGLVPGLEAQLVPFLEQQDAGTDLELGVTGYNLLAQGGEPEGPSVLVETLTGAAGALVVLVFVFASFLALVPLLVAAVSILSTFLVLLGLTYLTEVSFVVQFLVSLIGLGVAIDYSLLRDPVAGGAGEGPQQRRGGARVGPDGRARGGGQRRHGGDQPAGAGGHPGAVPALVRLRRPAHPDGQHPGGARSAAGAAQQGGAPRGLAPAPARGQRLAPLDGLVARGRAPSLDRCAGRGGGVGGAVPAAGDLRIGASRSESLASSGPAYEDLQRLRSGGVPAGVFTPLEVLVEGRDAAACAQQAADRARAVDGVAAALAAPQGVRGTSAVATVVPAAETVDTDEARVVDRITDVVSAVPGYVGIAGQGALVLDYLSAVYAPFPYSSACRS